MLTKIKYQQGFSLIEVMIVTGIMSMVALGFAQMIVNMQGSAKNGRIVIMRDIIFSSLSRVAGDPQSLSLTAVNINTGDNAFFQKCVMGATNPECQHDKLYDIDLYDSSGKRVSGTDANPVFYDSFGTINLGVLRENIFKVTSKFTAKCPNNAATCVQARTVSVTVLIQKPNLGAGINFHPVTFSILSAIPLVTSFRAIPNRLVKWFSDEGLAGLGSSIATENGNSTAIDVAGDFTASGKMGIGTTTPSAKLQVNGGILLGGVSYGAACTLKGEQNYDSSSGTPVHCNGTNWVDNQLTGAVVAFNLSSCPVGWSPASATSGRMIVGAGGEFAGTGGKSKHKLTVEEMPTHNHRFENPVSGVDITPVPGGGFSVFWEGGITYQVLPVSIVGGDQPHSIMNPYIVYLYCQKN